MSSSTTAMAQSVTLPFWPIFPRQSDGHEAIRQKGIQVKNGPSAQQLDRTPNAQGQCDYYRLLDKDEPKHLDWRKKLGGMLLRELGGGAHQDKWQQCFLFDFPEGYRLFEHIKSKVDGQAKAVKTHSGGGHDRQDAYLYGHPKGPKKRFRSPVEFFPHLLWLATDDAADPENCTCKLCCPVQLEAEKPARPEPVPIKNEGGPVAAPPPAKPVARDPPVQLPASRVPLAAAPAQSPASRPVTPGPATPAAPTPVPTPTPLPQPRRIDQQLDSQYAKFLARVGEVVWFQRDAGAWGLGLVTQRWIPKDGSSDRAYLVQPLSHPNDAPPTQVLLSDTKVKPWLAWSAPGCTYAFLQQNPGLVYSQVDWESLTSGRFGDGNAEVDASILAAKAVDSTFTLFERMKTTANMGFEEKHWNGIYLGAEKIWNGEPVRLHIGSGSDIMVVTDIIEQTPMSISQAGPAVPAGHASVHFVGDVYTYATAAAPDGKPPPMPPNQHLPIRMREDMRWRNEALLPAHKTFAFWKLVATQRRLDISEIKGRWYETSIVFAEPFHAAIKKNEGGNGIWMNSRGDCTGSGKVVGLRRDERTQALIPAIPKTTVLVDRLEPPDAHPPQGKPPTSEMQELGLGIESHEPNFALDDFMNLEGMDGEGMGFDQQFTFH